MLQDMNRIIKSIFNKEEMKKRLPFALLGGFTPPFTFFFFGILEIFAGNRDEFLFRASDFIGYIALIALAASVVLSALIMFLPNEASLVLFGASVWVCLMGYIQVLAFNSSSLGGDTGTDENTVTVIINTALWIITGAGIIFGAFMMKKKDILKKIYLIAIAALLVMNAAGCAAQIGNITRDRDTTAQTTETAAETTVKDDETTAKTAETDEDTAAETTVKSRGEETDPAETTVKQTETEASTTAETTTAPVETTAVTAAVTTAKPAETTAETTAKPVETVAETTAKPVETAAETTAKPVETTAETTAEPQENLDPAKAFLTKKGIDSVTKGKNIIIFIIDRFDVSFYEDIIKKTPDYFDDLDGFTYFGDNISLYSRTWPAVPTMISGVDNDFSLTASEYFNKAYTQSDFLKDLQKNNYKIKIYTQSYYCYREGTPFIGLADNISLSRGYTITSTGELVKNLVKLSAYRYAPNAFKSSIKISTSSFDSIAVRDGTAPQYVADDPDTCGQILKNGLSFDGEGDSYIFLHLNGAHSPYNMDENAERSSDANADGQIRGCFKMIKFYLSQLKELGVYDDATIIITGDHPRSRDDGKLPWQPRLTSLFVKPTGASGALKHSTAQVSQENLIPTLVKSAGIKTDNDYGKSYFEVPEGQDFVRYHKFQLSPAKGSSDPVKIVTYKVSGKGTDFENWEEYSTLELPGSLYR